MVSAKEIMVQPIQAQDANRIIRTLHYSGKFVRNSCLYFGVFLDGRCGGALQFGPSLDKRKLIGLVEGTRWNEFLELNRMALADWLPRNSESRALAVTMRILRRSYPHLKWIVSFADGTQCGDGTIYRASGFVLTGIVPSKNLCRLPSGQVIHKMTLESSPDSPRPELGGQSYYAVTGGRYDFAHYVQAVGGTILEGFQLRYLYFLDPAARHRLTVPVLPFRSIEEQGAKMFRGRVPDQEQVDQPEIRQTSMRENAASSSRLHGKSLP